MRVCLRRLGGAVQFQYLFQHEITPAQTTSYHKHNFISIFQKDFNFQRVIFVLQRPTSPKMKKSIPFHTVY